MYIFSHENTNASLVFAFNVIDNLNLSVNMQKLRQEQLMEMILNAYMYVIILVTATSIIPSLFGKEARLLTDLLCWLSADDFTLEKIIELGLDQFAEQISEVSGAASKELSIEQVGLLGFVSQEA